MSKTENFFIYGRNPIREILETRPKEVEKIYVKNTLKPSSYYDIKELSKNNHISITKVPGQKLFNLVGKVNDQGIVALLSTTKYTDFFEWIEKQDLSSNPAVLFLQGIEDPHNFGAILRTAAASGISAVVVPSENQAPVNATVFKTSAGTAGRIPIIRVHDVNQGFKDLSAAGFQIIGMDGSADNNLWSADLDKPIAFLIGNEGEGIPAPNLKRCNALVKIPMDNNVESLNASVSASLICYEWKRRRVNG